MRRDLKGNTECPDHEVTIWLPIAEVAEIAEFKNWEAVEKEWWAPTVRSTKVELRARRLTALKVYQSLLHRGLFACRS